MTAGRSVLPRGRGPSGLPLALIHGAGSDLLSDETAAEMRRRRPDMIYGKVPGRGHTSWLDEAESVAVVRKWVARASAPAKPRLYSTNSIAP